MLAGNCHDVRTSAKIELNKDNRNKIKLNCKYLCQDLATDFNLFQEYASNLVDVK